MKEGNINAENPKGNQQIANFLKFRNNLWKRLTAKRLFEKIINVMKKKNMENDVYCEK